jgi:hypothetical protein
MIALEARAPNVELKVTVAEPERTRLVLAYSLRNTGPHPLWLFNKLDRWTNAKDGRMLDPDLVYVKRDGDTLVLFKGVSELPPNTHVEMRTVPCLTQLEPGEVCEEKLSIRLPLWEKNDYDEPEDRHLVKTQILLPAVFELGYAVLTSPTARSRPYPVKTTTGTALTVRPMTPRNQLTIRTDLLPYALPFLKRREG